jgi:hypothetical protein
VDAYRRNALGLLMRDRNVRAAIMQAQMARHQAAAGKIPAANAGPLAGLSALGNAFGLNIGPTQ